jgi:hypothetical protein
MKSGAALRAAALVVAVVAGGPAVAATYNFAAIADGASFNSTAGQKSGFEGNWNAVDSAGTPPVVGAGHAILDAGIGVRGSAWNSLGTSADAYFDSSLAGLGVCSSPTCKSGVAGAVTDDDNAGPIGGFGGTGTETLSLAFSQDVSFTELVFRRRDHALANGAIDINGSSFSIANGSLGAASLAALGLASQFDFTSVPVGTGGTEFYISSASVAPVPLPAAGMLLVAAMLGLGAAAGRRRAAA